MGLPMAQNLVKAGHDVVGFDVVPAAIDAARAAGIPVADSGQDAACIRRGRHHDVPERPARDRRVPRIG